MTEPNSHRRLVVVGVLVLALFGGLLARLWFLQVTGGETLAVAAQRQRDRFVPIPAVRGTIYDRSGNVLAQTVPVTTFTVDRQKLTSEQRATLEKNLGFLMGKTPEDIGTLIDNQQYQPFESVPVVKDVTVAQAIFVAEHAADFPELTITRTTERRYPQGMQAAALLGYVGQVSQKDLQAHQGDGYDEQDLIGKAGAEQLFESELRGKPGEEKVEVDNQGRAVNTVQVTPPEEGHDVRLNVDLGVQRVAESSLQQGMVGARSLVDGDGGGFFQANAGAVIVLDARTGAVVAMASNPSFDPNDFIAGNADQYINDPNKPLLNRALNPLAPGSTFKTFTSVAMLQSMLYPDGADHVIGENPPGCFVFGNNEKRCNAGGTVLGSVDLPTALTVSSDVYFYTVGNEFWNRYRDEGKAAGFGGDVPGDRLPDAQHPLGNAIQHTAKTYGFGKTTGIGFDESVDGKEGEIPDHEYRVRVNPNDSGLQVWARGDSANLAVGQGDVLVTPLQLADAYAAFANGGTLYEPRLADSITQTSAGLPPGQFGPVAQKLDPVVKQKTDLDPQVRSVIESGLHGVISNPRGTAYGAFQTYQGVPVIGKTGTAQRSPNQDTSWFAAITNPDNDPLAPQYVVVAMVEQGGFGASVAAPIARRVIDFLNNPLQEPAPVSVAPAVGTEASN